MAAVLADAVHILRRGPEYHEDRKGDSYRDAVAWIMAERNAWPFCFVALCEALGFDADKVKSTALGYGAPRSTDAPSRLQRADVTYRCATAASTASRSDRELALS